MLVLVRSFSYTPRAGFIEEFLLHSSSWFYWGVSDFYTPRAGFCESFSYTPRAGFSEGFFYTLRAGFNEEFLLHFWY